MALPVYGNVDPPPPDPVATVIGNVLPSPLVNVIVFEDTDAVVSRLAVLTVLPPPLFPTS
jgi:hypothetical protein